MAIQDSDLFLIDDAGVSKKIRADKLKGGLDSTYANMKLLVNKPDYSSRFIYCKDLQSNLPDDHWLMAERSDVSYKVNGTDVHRLLPFRSCRPDGCDYRQPQPWNAHRKLRNRAD